MQMMDGRVARKILIDAGMPEDLTSAIAWRLMVPENVVNYALSLWRNGMRAEQIKTIFGNFWQMRAQNGRLKRSQSFSFPR